MNTEIATATETAEIQVLPPARPPVAEAIGQLMAHAESMSAAKELAEILASSDLVGPDYKGKPGNAAVAILYGAELGLNPIQSLQQIFVVHGKPAIYARTAVALLMGHGIRVETVSTSDDEVTVLATDPRTGRTEQSTWNIARATQAKYVSNVKYQTNPQEMLYAKAAMEVCRKIAPDILLGIPYSREELDLEPQPQRVHSERARGVDALRERAAQASQQPADEQPVEDAAAVELRQKWRDRLADLLTAGEVTDVADQVIVVATLAERRDDPPADRNDVTDAQLRTVVELLHERSQKGDLADYLNDLLNSHAAWLADKQEREADAAAAGQTK